MGTKRIWTLLMITLFGAMMTTASAVDHHVYSGNSVQTAITGATAGDTIYVHNYTGTYTKFDVNKQLYMIGVDMPTVDGSSGFTIKITANDCTVKGFEVISASGGYNCGEIVVESSGNLIKDNYINSNSNNGMLIHRYCDANFNTVINNTILGNGIRAIKIYGNSNTIAKNDLSGSSQAIGIYTPCTGGNLFYHNNMYAAISNNDGGNTWYNSTLNEGNYYSANSGCTDNDSNGICDIPYQIGADWDQYPLVDPWPPTGGDTTPPASITNIANSTGNFWINWTWNNPSDPDFNHTMVYIDNGWVLNTSGSFYNGSYSAHATKTISTHTVDTNGNVNSTWVNQTTTIPNNLPVLDPIGNKVVNEIETLAIDADATDSDSDTLTYSCNRTDLFADFNSATGAGNWTSGYGDAGIYYVDFGTADGYGGIDNETVQITVNEAEVTGNLLYFSPDTSTVPGYCYSVDVDVMARVNESNPITATDVYITFDPGCINITNWVNNSGVWNGSTCPLWSVPQGYVHITTVGENPALNGTVNIGTLTIHCNNTTCCGTSLNFTSQCMFIKGDSGFIYPERDNGSFLCGWYWKDYNGEEDGGYMPDFDQNQDFDVTQPGIEENYCAPTAMANSLWWFDQKYPDREVVPPGAMPRDLIQELAWLMDTNGQRTGIPHNGTYVDDEQAGIDEYLVQHNLTDLLYEHTELKPEFEWIEAEIKRCQDVKLDLGFYEVIGVVEIEPGYWRIEWRRIGGHAVTAAGVDSEHFRIAISDPDADNAKFGFPGIVRGPNHNHGGVPFHDLAYDRTQHNDGVSASHDIYNVAPSISPGGTWALTDPYWKDPAVAYWYEENNGGTWINFTETYIEIPPEVGEVFTEIEAAVAVSPKLEFGDAPDPAYPSLLASDGARHTPTTTECLGLNITTPPDWKDFELDANVPDLDIPFDDGLLTFVLAANNPAQTVDVEVTNLIPGDQTLILNILLDLNGDGDWNDMVGGQSEHVVRNQPIPLQFRVEWHHGECRVHGSV
jgi:parallel beta-helix repeat protein